MTVEVLTGVPNTSAEAMPVGFVVTLLDRVGVPNTSALAMPVGFVVIAGGA